MQTPNQVKDRVKQSKSLKTKTSFSFSQCFPGTIDFYGLGTIKPKQAPVQMALEKYHSIIFFKLIGEEQGYCILGFENEPHDELVILEIASLLAAKFSYIFSEMTGTTTHISPPERVTKGEAGFCVHLNKAPILQGYVYESPSDKVDLRFAFVSDSPSVSDSLSVDF